MDTLIKQNKYILMLKISLVSVINTVLSIARNKIFAVILGVTGLGIIGQLTNFNLFITYFISIGIPLGITKYISEWKADDNDEAIYSLFRSSLIILFIFASLISSVLIIFSDAISFFLWGTDKYNYLLIYLSLSFPFFVTTVIIDAYIRGLKKYNVFTLIAVINSIVSAIIFILLAYKYAEKGVGLAFFISSVSSLLITLIICAYYRVFEFSKIFNFKKIHLIILTSVIKLGIASLVIGASNQFALLYIRSEIIKDFGLDYNGYYQSIISISSSYIAIFSMIFGVHSLPLLSEKKSPKLFNEELNSTLFIVILLIVPIISLLFSFKNIIIPLLFSKDFSNASDFLLLFLLGDFFRVLSQSLVLALIAKSKIKLWLIVELVTYISMILIFIIFNGYFRYGPSSFSLAYFLAYIISLSVNLYFIITKSNFSFNRKIIRIFITSLLVLSLMFIYMNNVLTFLNFLIIPVLIIWFFYNVRIETIKGYFTNIKSKYIQ
ncbi:MAG: oligosaccharide flippase family protein [Ignavibacteriae bacterium]|nr:oligosaccharide flippase family protein [Ignavibacteriota bacterium]